MYTNFDLLCSFRHRYPPWSSIANGSDDTMTGVMHKPCNSAGHDYSINDHTTSYDEQLTSSHKETHELEKNCAMLQDNIAFICLIYMQYISISVCALLLK